MTSQRQVLREHPFRGEASEITVVGNGKDCTFIVKVPDGRAFAIPVGCAHTQVTCCEGIVVETGGAGDTAIRIRYRPKVGWKMQIIRAQVSYPGSDEDWARDCEVWHHMSTSKWPIESHWEVDKVIVELRASSEAASGD